MITVGIKELKNRLSEYLRLVRAGEAILVTDRGRAVAEIGPPTQATDLPVNAAIQELVRRGEVSLGASLGQRSYPALEPLLSWEEVRDLLDADRGE